MVRVFGLLVACAVVSPVLAQNTFDEMETWRTLSNVSAVSAKASEDSTTELQEEVLGLLMEMADSERKDELIATVEGMEIRSWIEGTPSRILGNQDRQSAYGYLATNPVAAEGYARCAKNQYILADKIHSEVEKDNALIRSQLAAILGEIQ